MACAVGDRSPLSDKRNEMRSTHLIFHLSACTLQPCAIIAQRQRCSTYRMYTVNYEMNVRARPVPVDGDNRLILLRPEILQNHFGGVYHFSITMRSCFGPR